MNDVDALVARARAAQGPWAALCIEKRVRALLPLKDRILERADAVARCVHEEVGKPEVEALLGEVLPSADVVAHWTETIADLIEPSEVALDGLAYPAKRGTLFREARGVVAVIMPWNFPVALPLRTIVPALLAGNAVVFKPSELTPRSAECLREMVEPLVPAGLFAIARGAGDAGAALCRADVDLVVFTGSAPVGRQVAHACADRLVPCALELGGKDAAIVLGDADLERAAQGVVWGAMMNAGQNCASIERVYVVRAVADAFLEKVRVRVAALRPGVDVGPLATDAQRATVERHLADARDRGAVVVAAASAPAVARAVAPTVVRIDSDDSALMRDETFGPVLPVAVVEDAAAAVERANASRYGLTASLWTRDMRAAHKLAHRLRAGVVTINNHGFTGALPAAPWSGQGETGWGVTGSPLALEALTRPRFVLEDRSRQARELWWFPYTPALTTIARSMATLRCSTRGVFARAKSLLALLRAMWERAREQ